MGACDKCIFNQLVQPNYEKGPYILLLSFPRINNMTIMNLLDNLLGIISYDRLSSKQLTVTVQRCWLRPFT